MTEQFVWGPYLPPPPPPITSVDAKIAKLRSERQQLDDEYGDCEEERARLSSRMYEIEDELERIDTDIAALERELTASTKVFVNDELFDPDNPPYGTSPVEVERVRRTLMFQ